MTALRTILFLSICLAGYIASAQEDCTLKLHKDSISVYTCRQPKSKFNLVRATFPIHARMSELAAMVYDVDGIKSWQYQTHTARLLKRVSEREVIYYVEVEAPVLTDNRDFVIRLTMNQDAKSRTLTILAESLPDYIPAKKNVVRVPYSKAVWKVMEMGPSHLHVDYSIDIDLGGALRPWMLNLVSHQAPYETFSAMREQIHHYRGKGLPFIKD